VEDSGGPEVTEEVTPVSATVEPADPTPSSEEGQPRPGNRLPLTWGVIKGTALPPDQEWWMVRRQRMLQAQQARRIAVPTALTLKPASSPQRPASTATAQIDGLLGSLANTAGYADGTNLFSWEELQAGEIAPGVLVRFKASVPLQQSPPSASAHHVVVAFSPVTPPRQPGAAGPYIIQAVVYDQIDDTYYVRIT
jgi:hypothetical protein